MTAPKLFRVLITHEALVYATDEQAAVWAARDDLDRGRVSLVTNAQEVTPDEALDLESCELDTVPLVAEGVAGFGADRDTTIRTWAAAASEGARA